MPDSPWHRDHVPRGALLLTAFVILIAAPASAAELPSFWVMAVRVAPAVGCGEGVVVFPCLSRHLPEGFRAVRYSWRVEPAFEDAFGEKDVAGPEVVICGEGEVLNPSVSSWREQTGQYAEFILKLDEKKPLDYWGKPGGYGSRIGPVLRIPAEDVSRADTHYMLHCLLEVRDEKGKLHEISHSRLVRFLPSRGAESELPEGMRDPSGVLPDAEAERILSGWLEFDDWYVQCLAVIRLKQLGREFRPEELNRFFRLAALVGDRPLVRRALDSLRPAEGAEGARKLLPVGCGWALPWAIRFGSDGTEAWLQARIERYFHEAMDPWERGRAIFHRARPLMEQYLALSGGRAVGPLCRLARERERVRDFDLILGALKDAAPSEALALARERPPTAEFPSSAAFALLLNSGRDEDVFLACEGLEHAWGRDLPGGRPARLPQEAVPVLIEKADHKKSNIRRNALCLLAVSREPVATEACLAALEEDALARPVAEALAKAGRDDLAHRVADIARTQREAGRRIDHLWPVLLLDPPAEVHDLVFDAYIRRRPYRLLGRFLEYLKTRAEDSCVAAERLLCTGEPKARRRAAGLLLELEDARGVPALIERLAKHPPKPRPVGGDAHPPRERKPDPEELTVEEMNCLAAFLPPGKLAATVTHFLTFSASGPRYMSYLDCGDGWAGSPEVLRARRGAPRIKRYIAAIEEYIRNRPCPSGGGPGPAPQPSPLNVVRLRGLPASAVQPLVESENDGTRALGASLLSGDTVRPTLERLLYDSSEEVRVAAFNSLRRTGRSEPWYWGCLLGGRKGGPARSAAVKSVNRWGGTVAQRRDVHKRILGLLAEGDSLGLAALEHKVEGEGELIARALSSPAMTYCLARDIVQRLSRRRVEDIYGTIHQALAGELRERIRAAIIRHIVPFAEDHHLPNGGVRRASGLARDDILGALKSESREVREAALYCLERTRVPGSIPLLVEFLANPGRHATHLVTRAAARQGPDERLVATLEELFRTGYGRNIGMYSGLAAYVSVAGKEAIPLLRELEIKLREEKGSFQIQEYGRLIAHLIQLGDEKTVARQARWFISTQWRSYRWTEWEFGDALKEEMGRQFVKKLEEAEIGEKDDVAAALCRYDLGAGIEALTALLRNSRTAKDAVWSLDRVTGIFGSEVYKAGYVGFDYEACARRVERWWHLERGRSLDVLKAEALFP